MPICRYGFLGPNGSGKSTIMKALAARSIPIPEKIDIFFLDHEYPATDKAAIVCVFEVIMCSTAHQESVFFSKCAGFASSPSFLSFYHIHTHTFAYTFC